MTHSTTTVDTQTVSDRILHFSTHNTDTPTYFAATSVAANDHSSSSADGLAAVNTMLPVDGHSTEQSTGYVMDTTSSSTTLSSIPDVTHSPSPSSTSPTRLNGFNVFENLINEIERASVSPIIITQHLTTETTFPGDRSTDRPSKTTTDRSNIFNIFENITHDILTTTTVSTNKPDTLSTIKQDASSSTASTNSYVVVENSTSVTTTTASSVTTTVEHTDQATSTSLESTLDTTTHTIPDSSSVHVTDETTDDLNSYIRTTSAGLDMNVSDTPTSTSTSVSETVSVTKPAEVVLVTPTADQLEWLNAKNTTTSSSHTNDMLSTPFVVVNNTASATDRSSTLTTNRANIFSILENMINDIVKLRSTTVSANEPDTFSTIEQDVSSSTESTSPHDLVESSTSETATTSETTEISTTETVLSSTTDMNTTHSLESSTDTSTVEVTTTPVQNLFTAEITSTTTIEEDTSLTTTTSLVSSTSTTTAQVENMTQMTNDGLSDTTERTTETVTQPTTTTETDSTQSTDNVANTTDEQHSSSDSSTTSLTASIIPDGFTSTTDTDGTVTTTSNSGNTSPLNQFSDETTTSVLDTVGPAIDSDHLSASAITSDEQTTTTSEMVSTPTPSVSISSDVTELPTPDGFSFDRSSTDRSSTLTTNRANIFSILENMINDIVKLRSTTVLVNVADTSTTIEQDVSSSTASTYASEILYSSTPSVSISSSVTELSTPDDFSSVTSTTISPTLETEVTSTSTPVSVDQTTTQTTTTESPTSESTTSSQDASTSVSQTSASSNVLIMDLNTLLNISISSSSNTIVITDTTQTSTTITGSNQSNILESTTTTTSASYIPDTTTTLTPVLISSATLPEILSHVIIVGPNVSTSTETSSTTMTEEFTTTTPVISTLFTMPSTDTTTTTTEQSTSFTNDFTTLTSETSSTSVTESSTTTTSVTEPSTTTTSVAESSTTTTSVAEPSTTTTSVAESSTTTTSVAESSTTTTSVAESTTTTTSVTEPSTTTTSVTEPSTTTTSVAESSTTTTSVAEPSTTTTSVAESSTTTTSSATETAEINTENTTHVPALGERQVDPVNKQKAPMSWTDQLIEILRGVLTFTNAKNTTLVNISSQIPQNDNDSQSVNINLTRANQFRNLLQRHLHESQSISGAIERQHTLTSTMPMNTLTTSMPSPTLLHPLVIARARDLRMSAPPVQQPTLSTRPSSHTDFTRTPSLFDTFFGPSVAEALIASLQGWSNLSTTTAPENRRIDTTSHDLVEITAEIGGITATTSADGFLMQQFFNNRTIKAVRRRVQSPPPPEDYLLSLGVRVRRSESTNDEKFEQTLVTGLRRAYVEGRRRQLGVGDSATPPTQVQRRRRRQEVAMEKGGKPGLDDEGSKQKTIVRRNGTSTNDTDDELTSIDRESPEFARVRFYIQQNDHMIIAERAKATLDQLSRETVSDYVSYSVQEPIQTLVKEPPTLANVQQSPNVAPQAAGMSPATQMVIYVLVGFVLIAAVVVTAFACKRFGERHSAMRKTPENSARAGLMMNQPMGAPVHPEVFTKRSIVPMNIGSPPCSPPSSLSDSGRETWLPLPALDAPSSKPPIRLLQSLTAQDLLPPKNVQMMNNTSDNLYGIRLPPLGSGGGPVQSPVPPKTVAIIAPVNSQAHRQRAKELLDNVFPMTK